MLIFFMQNFREIPPTELFQNILQKICEDGTTIDYDAYKRFLFYGLDFQAFEPYYHASKKKYLSAATFAKFCTVIRQICSVLDIGIEIEHKHSGNGKYHAIYRITKEEIKDKEKNIVII